MIIELETGQRIELEDGATPEQIDEVIGHASQTEPGFMDRLGEHTATRTQQLQAIDAAKQSGQQGAIESGFQKAGVGAGLLNDVAGEVITSVTPEFVKDAGRDVLDYAGSTVPGKFVAEVAHGAAQQYSDYAANNPRTARNIGAVGNIGALVGGAGIAKGSAPVVADVAKEGAGAVAGGAGRAGGVIGKAILPSVNEGLKDTAALAQKYKIPVSFDQITDSRAVKNVQKVSQEMPFSGQAKFREKQISAWQRALLDTVGVKGDKFSKSTMDRAFTSVGKEFDSLGAGKVFALDENFTKSINAIKEDAASTATKDAIDNFTNVLEKKILANAGPDGTIPGEKLGKIRSDINRLARKANNPDTQELLHDLENAVIDVMTVGDDAASGAFSATKQKYKNLIVLEPLAAKAKGGNISPALLNNRVSKIYGRAHTRGQAGPIGELAQVGHELLPELGGSDTTQKILYAGGMGGLATGAIMNPAAAVGAAGLLAGLSTTNRLAQAGLNRNQALIKKAIGKNNPRIADNPLSALSNMK